MSKFKDLTRRVVNENGDTVIKVFNFPLIDKLGQDYGSESMWVLLVDEEKNNVGTGVLLNNPMSSIFRHGQLVGFIFIVEIDVETGDQYRIPSYFPILPSTLLFTPGDASYDGDDRPNE